MSLEHAPGAKPLVCIGAGGEGGREREERSRFSIIFWFLFCFSNRDRVQMEKGVRGAKPRLLIHNLLP